MKNKKVLNYLKAGAGLVVVLLVALLVVPPIIGGPVKSAVKSLAAAASGDPNLFGDLTPSPGAIAQRVLQQRGGQIRQEDLPGILSEIIRLYRPDFNSNIVNSVMELAVPLVLAQLPGPINTPAELTPLLTRMVPLAIAQLPGARVEPKYPPQTLKSFDKETFTNIAYTAIGAGVVTLIWLSLYRPRCPQEEKRRVFMANILIAVPALIVGFYLYQNFPGSISQYVSFKDNGRLILTTFVIVFSYLTLSLIFYFLVALALAGLPYLAERFWVLAPWRALVLPVLTNIIGNWAHLFKIAKVLKQILDVLRKHFPEEIAK